MEKPRHPVLNPRTTALRPITQHIHRRTPQQMPKANNHTHPPREMHQWKPQKPKSKRCLHPIMLRQLPFSLFELPKVVRVASNAPRNKNFFFHNIKIFNFHFSLFTFPNDFLRNSPAILLSHLIAVLASHSRQPHLPFRVFLLQLRFSLEHSRDNKPRPPLNSLFFLFLSHITRFSIIFHPIYQSSRSRLRSIISIPSIVSTSLAAADFGCPH